jgi:hypothetical protein
MPTEFKSSPRALHEAVGESHGNAERVLRFTTIDAPDPSLDASAKSINNRSEVIGEYFGGIARGGAASSFTYVKGASTTINVSDSAFNTRVFQVNDPGEVAGYTSDFHSLSRHGFIYDTEHGTLTAIDAPGANFAGTSAVGINNSGKVVGDYVSGGSGHGFIYSKGNFTIIDAPKAASTDATGINNHNEVVGNYIDSSLHNHGFIYDKGAFTIIDVPTASHTQALGISDTGKVFGEYEDRGNHVHSFIYDNGAFTSIDAKGATSTEAFGINNRGEVVGDYYDGVHYHGFLYESGTLTTIDFPGATNTHALGINSRGEVVGSYNDSNGSQHGFITSAAGKPALTLSDLVTGQGNQISKHDLLPGASAPSGQLVQAGSGSGLPDNSRGASFSAFASPGDTATHVLLSNNG